MSLKMAAIKATALLIEIAYASYGINFDCELFYFGCTLNKPKQQF